jgi:hypothetical protein
MVTTSARAKLCCHFVYIQKVNSFTSQRKGTPCGDVQQVQPSHKLHHSVWSLDLGRSRMLSDSKGNRAPRFYSMAAAVSDHRHRNQRVNKKKQSLVRVFAHTSVGVSATVAWLKTSDSSLICSEYSLSDLLESSSSVPVRKWCSCRAVSQASLHVHGDTLLLRDFNSQKLQPISHINISTVWSRAKW